MQGSNAELRDRVRQLSAQAEAAQAQAEALQGLQASLQDSAGPSVEALIEAAVGRERALQDTRNKKVLELLNNKVCHAASINHPSVTACRVQADLYDHQGMVNCSG